MTTTDLKISKETQKLIECLDGLNKQWDLIYCAIAFIYGEDQSEQIMRDQVNQSFDKLKSIVQGFLIESINYKMGNIPFEEI